jgi:alkanesulfonate monooxygenase SsuD/methylene tetrahydromethanopterin reductase-like flavin-dependent oxidoreductase (luciferase family)
MVTPKPFQDPHPSCWMACVSADSIEIAGEAGLGALAMSIMRPIDETARIVERYRGAQKRAKPLTRVTTNQIAAYTLVHCVEDKADLETNDVWRSVWWWYQNLAEFSLQWELPNYSEEDRKRAFPLLEARARGEFDLDSFHNEDMIIIGTPDECLRKMKRYADAGLDRVICYKQFGYLKSEDIQKSMRLLDEHVIPYI